MTMPSVVGLDLSLRKTGVALVSSRGWAACSRVTSAGGRGDDIFARWRRLRYARDEILELVPEEASLAVIERQIGRSTGSTHDRSGLWWMVVSGLLAQEIPVAEVIPQHVKMFLGTAGNAEKSEVTAAAVKRYGKLVEITDDNEADALGLADLGARHLGFGLKVSVPAGSMRILEKITWP